MNSKNISQLQQASYPDDESWRNHTMLNGETFNAKRWNVHRGDEKRWKNCAIRKNISAIHLDIVDRMITVDLIKIIDGRRNKSMASEMVHGAMSCHGTKSVPWWHEKKSTSFEQNINCWRISTGDTFLVVLLLFHGMAWHGMAWHGKDIVITVKFLNFWKYLLTK